MVVSGMYVSIVVDKDLYRFLNVGVYIKIFCKLQALLLSDIVCMLTYTYVTNAGSGLCVSHRL